MAPHNLHQLTDASLETNFDTSSAIHKQLGKMDRLFRHTPAGQRNELFLPFLVPNSCSQERATQLDELIDVATSTSTTGGRRERKGGGTAGEGEGGGGGVSSDAVAGRKGPGKEGGEGLDQGSAATVATTKPVDKPSKSTEKAKEKEEKAREKEQEKERERLRKEKEKERKLEYAMSQALDGSVKGDFRKFLADTLGDKECLLVFYTPCSGPR